MDLSRDRVLGNVRHGRGAMYKDGVPRDTVLTAVEELRSRLDRFRMEADADLAALLQRELRGAIARYEQLKAAAGALDFLDLLVRARDLVRGNPLVRRGFQARFTHIFVDEFQDTDPLQAEILLLLAADDAAETDWRRVRPVRGRLFLVGDPKQSIYRFRRADVGIYREVSQQLAAQGAQLLQLNTSFRSVPEIQACVNAAFAPVMTGDELTLQAPYVPLAPSRPALPGQPAVVALPVPSPYATRYVSGVAIDKSLPSAVGAMVEWIINQSGWKVTERSGEAPVAVSAKHVCLLFRRFVSWQTDVTRPYVEALEARGIPHVLVGGRAFHEREEIEAIRAALAAVEWPDDELSVFATLRGPVLRDQRRGPARLGVSLRAEDGEGVQAPRLPSASHSRGVRARHAAGRREAASDRRRPAAPQAAPSPSQQRVRRRRCRARMGRRIRRPERAGARDAGARRLRAAHRR